MLTAGFVLNGELKMSTILIAKNQTVGDITLKDLASVVCPGSGQVNLTDLFSVTEIQLAADLNAEIVAGNIIFNDGSVDLTTEESLTISEPVVSKTETDISIFTSTSVPDSDWDDSDTAGVGKSFAINSYVQNTTTSALYRCEDASTGAAIWNIVVQERL